jgi:CHAD domain-containing protein
VIENDQLMTEVAVTLKTARARYAAWESGRTTDPPNRLAARGVRDDFAAIAPGLTRVYRRGRRAMRQAYHDGSAESFHEWRKRVKYLRYQLESLEPIWPELIGAHAGRLDDLGELLGDHNDLAVLRQIVLNDDAATADQRERTLLLVLIHRASLELQYEARTLGSTLYTEAPNLFVGRLGSYWNASRGIMPAGA